MAWYDDAVFYHIYPLGLAGAPALNPYGAPVHRLNALEPWIDHIRSLGCTALYIGPLFESVGHGYETTDYRRLDSRLGDNDDLKRFVARCHAAGLRVILDGVFNHTGRDFFAFRDLREHREGSRYRDWYCRVNFEGNNEYNDGFSYDNWGGYNLLAKLNLRNGEVCDYLLETVRFWVREFDIDGLRLDAADVLDFDFMRRLRALADTVKPEFWLMGEVIHGDYARWANGSTLHSVTNYQLHKALYSGHNDHNYFEIAHTVQRHLDMGLGRGTLLYSFVDNHDVARIMSKLNRREHFFPVHVLLYTLPGIPSIYYGSEYGIEGRKEYGSDASLRPCLDLEALERGPGDCVELVRALGRVRAGEPALRRGDYRQLALTTTQYAFARGDVIVTVNNADHPATFDLAMGGDYVGALGGRRVAAESGRLRLEIGPNSGEIWIPASHDRPDDAPLRHAGDGPAPMDLASAPRAQAKAAPQRREGSEPAAPVKGGVTAPRGDASGMDPVRTAPSRRPDDPPATEVVAVPNKPYEEMTVPELQAAILAKLAANGPVTDRMRREVAENVYPNSLLNWVRSFR